MDNRDTKNAEKNARLFPLILLAVFAAYGVILTNHALNSKDAMEERLRALQAQEIRDLESQNTRLQERLGAALLREQELGYTKRRLTGEAQNLSAERDRLEAARASIQEQYEACHQARLNTPVTQAQH